MSVTWRVAQPVLERIRADVWRELDVATDTEGVVRWAPLIEFGSGEKWLGVSLDGNWRVGPATGPARPLQEGWHVPLLPILESNYETWLHNLAVLRGRLPELAHAVERVVHLPSLLAAAIEGEGAYWPALALGWLEGSPAIPLPMEALAHLAEAGKSRPQSLRHRASALLRRSRSARTR
jgi:hypothetical protein